MKKHLFLQPRLLLIISVLTVGFSVLFHYQNADAGISITTHEKQFYTVGSKIIDPDGKVFTPIGANVGFSPNNFDWAGSAKGQSDKALAWGWNTIRLTFICTTAESYSLVNAKDGDTVLLNHISEIVDEYTKKKIVVMLECHDTKNNENDAANFWTHAADKFKNNPYVWFNYANEPEWDNAALWVKEQKEWLALIRSRGAENLFVADVLFAGNDNAYSGVKQVYDPSIGPAVASGQCNVLMSMHNYGGLANSEDDVMRPEVYQSYWKKVQDADLPMVIGEYGLDYRLTFQKQPNGKTKVVAVDGTSDPKSISGDQYNHAANGQFATLNYAKDYGIGHLAWHGTFASELNLSMQPYGGQLPDKSYIDYGNFYNIINANGTGNSANYSFSRMGQDLWDAGHNKPTAEAFTGDYKKSNCASIKTVASVDPNPTNPSDPIASTPISPTLPKSPIALQPIGSTKSAQSTNSSISSYIANLPTGTDAMNSDTQPSTDTDGEPVTNQSDSSSQGSNKDENSDRTTAATDTSEPKKEVNIIIPIAIGVSGLIILAGVTKLIFIAVAALKP